MQWEWPNFRCIIGLRAVRLDAQPEEYEPPRYNQPDDWQELQPSRPAYIHREVFTMVLVAFLIVAAFGYGLSHFA